MSKGHGVSGYTHTQKQLDDYANQHNPNNHAYWDNLDNHANQCNPITMNIGIIEIMKKMMIDDNAAE